MKAILFFIIRNFLIKIKTEILLIILGIIGFNQCFAQNLNIGVITDYKYNIELQNRLKKNITEEVAKTIGSSTQLYLLDENIFATEYDTSKINEAYSKLSSRCDIIILIGTKSVKTLLESNAITKPTIALGIFNVEFQNIPLTQKGTSGIDNFSYILTSGSLEQELKQFYEVFPFKKLSLLFYEETINTLGNDNFLNHIETLSQHFNSSINLVTINDEITTSLQQIPQDTDAVFLGTNFEIPRDGVLEIIDYLNTKAIPSYSPLQLYVEAGILSGVTSQKDATSIFRKLGLMIDEIIKGENAKDLSVSFGQKKQLYLNMETVKAIGFAPSFQTLFTANLLNAKIGTDEFTYSLTEILEKAIDENLGVQVSYMDISLTEQDIKEAKSNYLPTINVAIQGSQINEEATNEFIGQSERSVIQSANATQLLYSEPAIANIKIHKLLNEAQKYATKQEVNTTIFQTYQFYLNILFSKSNVLIQRENLEVLRKNLELAEIQSDIGATTNSDVYRWKAEVANTTQNLIEAQTDLIIAKANLNTFLNNTLDKEFDVEDINLESNLFGFYESNFLVSQVKNPQDIQKISQYLFEYANINFPSVKQLEYSIQALESQQKSENRAFYLPNLSLGINQSEVLFRGGKASEPSGEFSNFIDRFWNVGVTLSYPLFEGNRKNIRRQQTSIQTEQLTLQKKELVNNLELSIQNAMANLVTGKTNIVLSEKSAENAQKNFDIVQELYAENSISIVQFLDAQNAALSAKLNYINSIYNFILSFAELENSIGFFSMLASAAEKQIFQESLINSINN